MKELKFYTLDVFTSEMFGGNQLAVFPDAPALEDRVLQAIAREFNLSETVFVRPPETPGALHRARIFTPSRELPFAGHPTIGTAQLLVELEKAPLSESGVADFALEEGVGLVPVSVHRETDGSWFTWLTAARLPEKGPLPASLEALAAVLRLDPAEMVSNETEAPCAYSAGVPFTLVPVRSRESLGRIRLDVSRWRESLAASQAPALYVFCRGESERAAELSARMFAPAMGIEEDPATGAAAAALAGYLWERHPQSSRFVISQGIDMGRPSKIHLEMSGSVGLLESVRVGGSAVRVSEGVFRFGEALPNISQ